MNEHVSAFFQELETYSKSEIAERLGISIEETKFVIGNLRTNGILKLKEKGTDKDEIGNPVVSETDKRFTFDFVGIVECADRILKIYPKYIKREPCIADMRLAVRAIEKTENNKNFVLNIANDNEDRREYNRLSIALYLLKDYFEHGVYRREREVLEKQGQGEIDWDYTINNTFPILQNGKPYYTDYFTVQNETDENNYIGRLHECLVSLCSKLLKETGLDEIFGIETPLLYEGARSDFGEDAYIKDRILSEINVQFVTQKQLTLRAMYAIIEKSDYDQEDTGFSFYGTNSFNHVWEKACAEVFGSQLDLPLSSLTVFPKETRKESLRAIIQKPIWTDYEKRQTYESETLRPDFVSVVSTLSRQFFTILDAKYYDVSVETFSGLPGVGDIDKQQLYQLAYSDFIHAHNLEVVNAFIFPNDASNNRLFGKVEMPILSKLALRPVQLVMLSAEKLLSAYSSGNRLSIEDELNILFGA